MQSPLLRVARSACLSLLAVACSPERPGSGEPDDQVPATAVLTIARTGPFAGTVSSATGEIRCGDTCSAELPVGTSVTLAAGPDTGAVFAGWDGGGCTGGRPSCTFTIAGATTVTAAFGAALYPVRIELGGSGGGRVIAPAAGLDCPADCIAKVAHGTELSLTALANALSQHVGWASVAGDAACAGGDAVCRVTITGPTTIQATFAGPPSLAVSRAGGGSGIVKSEPAGIDCGEDCGEAYRAGAEVTLTPITAEGSVFTGWSGACAGTGPCTVQMDSARLVTASFERKRQVVTVERLGAGAGTVRSELEGIDCGASCTADFEEGTTVLLTASPEAGSQLVGWSGCDSVTDDTCKIILGAAATITATFAPSAQALDGVRDGSVE
jgi:hypothetical protein